VVAGRARDSSIGNVPTRAVVCEGKAKGAYCVGEMVPACSAAAAAILNLILAMPADSGVAPTCYTDSTEVAREYRARDRSIDNVPTRRVKEGKGGPLPGRSAAAAGTMQQRAVGVHETRILSPCTDALKNKCYFISGAYKCQTMQLKYDTIYNYSIIPTFSGSYRILKLGTSQISARA
jgi:hypothetical protein